MWKQNCCLSPNAYIFYIAIVNMKRNKIVIIQIRLYCWMAIQTYLLAWRLIKTIEVSFEGSFKWNLTCNRLWSYLALNYSQHLSPSLPRRQNLIRLSTWCKCISGMHTCLVLFKCRLSFFFSLSHIETWLSCHKLELLYFSCTLFPLGFLFFKFLTWRNQHRPQCFKSKWFPPCIH